MRRDLRVVIMRFSQVDILTGNKKSKLKN